MCSSVGWSEQVAPPTSMKAAATRPDGTADLRPSAPVGADAGSPGAQIGALRTPPVPAAPPPLDEGSKVINAERLMIKFQGYPDLSGEYRINSDSTVTIPVIGRVSVGDSDSSQLERVLADRVRQVAGREAFVTVEIAQYRPIFITGYVKTSGAIAWRPGMTVLHAVSMAGGLYRASGDGDVEATRLQRATADLARVLAALARLKAEQTGAQDIEIPPRLVELAGPPVAQQLIQAQRSSFISRRNTLETQRAMLTRGISTGEQELVGLNEQSSRLKEQLNLRRELKNKLDDLLKRGIVTQQRAIQELSLIADLEEKSTNVAVAITRVQSSLVQMRRQVQGLQQEHQALLDSETLKLERDSAQLEIDIKSALVAYHKITGEVPGADSLAEINRKLSIEYRITRSGQNESAVEKGVEYTLLRPGDIVVVSAKQ